MKSYWRHEDRTRISVSLPCRKKSLRKARGIVKKFAVSHGFAGDAEDIALAAQEALKNIIQHACPADNTMRFFCTISDGTMVVEVVDYGMGFDLAAVEEEPSSPMALHGRGLKLVKGLMDEVSIKSGQNGTVVHMEKRLQEHV
jgi:anti-sigma regulatory factor (Ser/Thr protein kinase)